MCQILGISSSKQYTANNVLRKFFENSTEHPDGWGLAVFRKHGVSMEKEAMQATKSKYLSQRLSRDITCENLLAHIRRASIGSIEYANCHPFIWDDESGRTWTLIHNGTFFEPDLITPYLPKQEGTTDSEAVLLYIIDQINQATDEKNRKLSFRGDEEGYEFYDQELTWQERFAVVDEAVCALSHENRLNLLIYDGEIMYAHCNFRGTLYELYADGTRFLSTQPLSYAEWKPVPLNTLCAYKRGELIKTGTDHGNEFFEEGHDMSMVYLSYAEL